MAINKTKPRSGDTLGSGGSLGYTPGRLLGNYIKLRERELEFLSLQRPAISYRVVVQFLCSIFPTKMD